MDGFRSFSPSKPFCFRERKSSLVHTKMWLRSSQVSKKAKCNSLCGRDTRCFVELIQVLPEAFCLIKCFVCFPEQRICVI